MSAKATSANYDGNMREWVRILTCTALIFLSPDRGRTQSPIVAGEVEITPPAGWTVENQASGAVILKRQDKVSSLILVGSGPAKLPMNQTLTDTMRNSVHISDLDLKVSDGISVSGYPAMTFDEVARPPKGSRLRIVGIGLDLGGRYQVAWLATGSNSDARDRVNEFNEMVRTWRFKVPTKNAWNPAKPRSVPSGLAGFYWGSKIENQYNGFTGSLDLRAIREHIVLLPNGQAYFGIPPEGRVLDMDFDAMRRLRPSSCGTWSVDGDEIVFERATDIGLIRRVSSKLNRSSSGSARIHYRGIDLSPATPAPSDLRIQGSYTTSNVTMANTAFSSTTASSARTISFTLDGRYAKMGFTAVSFSSDSGDSRSSGAGKRKSEAENGSYTIDGFRLTLKPDNAQPQHFTVLIETSGSSPGALFINGAAYLRGK